MANSRRYRDDDAWRALRFEVCVACRSVRFLGSLDAAPLTRLTHWMGAIAARMVVTETVSRVRDGSGDTGERWRHIRRRCSPASPPLPRVLEASAQCPRASPRRYIEAPICPYRSQLYTDWLTLPLSLLIALLHSNSLQDDRLLSRPGTEYRERGGHTTSAKALFDDSEDFRSHRHPKADSESGSRRGRRRLPSESTLSSLIASTRASFDAWRRRKKVSSPALIPVPPPTATVAGAAVFSHELSHSVDAAAADTRSNSTSDSDMELSTIDLRTRRRRQQRRPTSTSIDYSFSTSELELSTVDLRQARDCKRRPTSSVSSEYSSSDSEMDLSTVDLRRARDYKRRPSSSMPNVLHRDRQGGSGRGGDAALRLATAMTPSRPDPLSISYVKHYK